MKILSKLHKQESNAISQLAAEYYLGPGVVGSGSIKTENDIYLDCDYSGELITQGVIEIDVNARVKANLECRTLHISGHFEGDALVKEQAEIASNATFAGSLSCSNIKIDQGAKLNSKIKSG